MEEAFFDTPLYHEFAQLEEFGRAPVKLSYRGLKRNTAQIVALFAMPNLWMMRRKLMEAQ